jgi:hypothetical protein
MKAFLLMGEVSLEFRIPLEIKVDNAMTAETRPISVLLKENWYLATSGMVVINMLLEPLIAMVSGTIMSKASRKVRRFGIKYR